jgi:hypothetical protein
MNLWCFYVQFCRHIGVSPGLVGMIAGASDFASMFATPGIAHFFLSYTPAASFLSIEQ